jgi:hypothetical protein
MTISVPEYYRAVGGPGRWIAHISDNTTVVTGFKFPSTKTRREVISAPPIRRVEILLPGMNERNRSEDLKLIRRIT